MIDKFDLTGKRALVGGSSQGIGGGIAQQLAEQNASVILVARHEEDLKQKLDQLPNNGNQKHSYLVVDYDNPDQLEAAVTKELENGPIHIVVNNTGGPPPGAVHSANIEEFTTAFRQHIVCNQVLAKLCLPGMKSEGYGRFINVISTSVKQPIPGLGVSNTIRGATANWAKTLSMEVAEHGITVNNILPGYINTRRIAQIAQNRANNSGRTAEEEIKSMAAMVPSKRLAEPDEVGYLAAFLASPAASYINGINVPIDGGRTASL